MRKLLTGCEHEALEQVSAKIAASSASTADAITHKLDSTSLNTQLSARKLPQVPPRFALRGVCPVVKSRQRVRQSFAPLHFRLCQPDPYDLK